MRSLESRAALRAALCTFPLLAAGAGAAGAGAAPAALKPGSAQGTFTLNGKAVPIVAAYAGQEKNPFDDALVDVVVALTDAPIPAEVLAGADELDAALRQAKIKTYVVIKLRQKGKDGGMPGAPGLGDRYLGSRVLAHVGLDSQLQSSPDMDSKLQPVALTKDAVSGTLSSGGPQSAFGKYKFEYNISFNASIKAHKAEAKLDPKSAQKLPPGGGEPGKAYLALNAAIHKGDFDAIVKMAPPGKQPSAEELKQMKQMLPMIQAMTASDVKVLGGLVSGDKATLDVQGSVNGQKQTGTVELQLAGGSWHMLKESWK